MFPVLLCIGLATRFKLTGNSQAPPLTIESISLTDMHKASHIINVSLPDFLQHYRRTGSPAMRNLSQSFALLTALSSVASSSVVCNVGSNDPIAFSEISLDYLVIGTQNS
ncbi:hypothetical protein DFJ43DRAFT_1067149 [Lentinula guzmanii]|uniref:Uncharacterized protein n=1 Tax=Lentinula guzmanii TaxID=2804957 RepID=A0AA38JBS3_9AGAR|nr:hypothetical protein DFJ43DRAFT_1067149 [Lentinula guzmanii]